jgi:hypothetical protein
MSPSRKIVLAFGAAISTVTRLALSRWRLWPQVFCNDIAEPLTLSRIEFRRLRGSF